MRKRNDRCGRQRLAGRRGQSGMALPIALIITFLVMVLGLAYLEMNRIEALRSVRDQQSLQAQAAAELGLGRARAMAMSQKLPWGVMKYNGALLNYTANGAAPYNGNNCCNLFTNVATPANAAVTYSVVIEDVTGFAPTNNCYRIHAYGTAGPITRHVTVLARTLTYAAFGWLTNDENGVYFRDGDTIDGWVYTNDQLNVNGDPVFKGKVNSTAASIHYGNGGPPNDSPSFQSGLYLNSASLNTASLINNGQIDAVRQQALQSNGIWLGANGGYPYRVTFNATGTVTIEKSNNKGKWTTVVDKKNLSATNGAIYIEDTVQVSGTLNGKVTLATPSNKDIQITGDLVYAHPADKTDVWKDTFDPTDAAFNDKLGLMAGHDIVIDVNWSTYPADMYIMGSMLAATGSFRNADYTTSPLKKLHTYGGIAQNVRGPVGQLNGTGFLKDYKYDKRFMTEPPPFFPTVTYDFNTWNVDP